MGSDLAYLAVWLIGLFSLIGFVLAAVARLVHRDTIEYDKEFLWKFKPGWDRKDEGEP